MWPVTMRLLNPRSLKRKSSLAKESMLRNPKFISINANCVYNLFLDEEISLDYFSLSNLHFFQFFRGEQSKRGNQWKRGEFPTETSLLQSQIKHLHWSRSSLQHHPSPALVHFRRRKGTICRNKLSLVDWWILMQ